MPDRSRGRPFASVLDIAAAVIVLGAAIMILTRTGAKPAVPSEAETFRTDFAAFLRLAQTGDRIGPDDAPVVIVIFNDYVCGYCAELQETVDALQARYPEHLAISIKHFVRPQLSAAFAIANAAVCAGAFGAFEQFHRAAFDNGQVLQHTAGWRQVTSLMPDVVSERIEECALSYTMAERIEKDWADGLRLKIAGTPTVFVNGHRVEGAVPLANLDSLIAASLPSRMRARASR